MAEKSYTPGTYEAQLKSQGYNLAEIKQQYDYGNNINPGEYNQITSRFQSPMDAQRQAINQGYTSLQDAKFDFDPNKYLPGIKQTAQSIYGPQIAQLQALQKLSDVQTEQTKQQTKESFDKRMQQEVEAINRRGAYFSGGAVQNEQNIRTEQGRALQSLDLQAQASRFQNIAQQAGLSAEQAEYIQNSLYNNEASAYNRWSNERNFDFNVLQAQQSQYNTDRSFARNVFESDRDYGLSLKQMDLAEKQFSFDKKKYGEQFAWDKFKYEQDRKDKLRKEGASSSTKKFSESLYSNMSDAIEMGDDYRLNPYDTLNYLTEAKNSVTNKSEYEEVQALASTLKSQVNENDYIGDRNIVDILDAISNETWE